MKLGYLPSHLVRMWTRFNCFVSVESACRREVIFGDSRLSNELAVVGAVLVAPLDHARLECSVF